MKTFIDGYENMYEITREGKVISHKTPNPKVLTQKVSNRGYRTMSLVQLDGKNNVCALHRLVAQAFIPNPRNYPEVDHINEDKTDNRAENLRWCTSEMNKRYYQFGRCNHTYSKKARGPKNVGVPINIDGVEFESTHSAARHIVECNPGKKIENVRKELRKMHNGRRSFGSIYGHQITPVAPS